MFSLISAFTFGSIGAEGRSLIPDLQQTTWNNIGLAFAGGVIFNLSNILLSGQAEITVHLLKQGE